MSTRLRARALARRGAAGLLAATIGCVPARGGWDVGRLEAAAPEVAGIAQHRLGDLAPHFLPVETGLMLFLCRWEIERPLRVALPGESETRVRGAFLRALSAWEDALPGLRFVETEEDPDIAVRVAAAGGAGYVPAGTADTVVDCRIGEATAVSLDSKRVRASLAHASIVVRSEVRDALGRAVRLSEAELIGSTLHELGHALGFAGHVAAGGSVMVATRETVRDVGARVIEGKTFESPTLRALYALPSGLVVGRKALAAGEFARFEALRARAREAKLAGPFARVGSTRALILWRRAGRMGPSLRVAQWPDVLRRRDAIRFEPARRRAADRAAGKAGWSGKGEG